MSDIIVRTLIIFFLVLLNGFFAGAEIAVISSRWGRLKELRERGVKGATAAIEMKRDPTRFFASIQVGITFISSLASAIGGALAVERIRPLFENLPGLSGYSATLAIGATVLVISYFMLVFGELAPKSIAVRGPENFAVLSSPVVRLFELVVSPLISFLTLSTKLVLGPFGGLDQKTESFPIQKEVLILVHEAKERGAITKEDADFIKNALEFPYITVREIMVPRTKMFSLTADMTPEEAAEKALLYGYTKYPVYKDGSNQVCGILHTRKLFGNLLKKKKFSLTDVLDAPFFVPETRSVASLLREMQEKRVEMAVVVDEYGDVSGLVCLEDVIEQVVGEIYDELRKEAQPVIFYKKRGAFLVEGSESVRKLRTQYNLPLPESHDYETIAGLILSKLGEIPKEGQFVIEKNVKIEVVKMEKRRIAWVRIERLDNSTPADGAVDA